MYLALYRKYRPETFRDVVSQEHITRTLQNQLKSGQIAHAYLFTGTRGTGKTTCAKILAKAINCLNPVDGNPCLQCESCKKIAEGSTDIIEMDAASNNGVEDVRQLRDEIVYTPIDVKYKVYIIDEVHMLSASAFNALLKTIEEPPAHVVFILATTDVYKVPATILSRCQRFQFRKIDPADSAKRLAEIAEKEGVKLRPDAAMLLTRLSDGAMRDAVSLLDQCISAGDEVTLQTVTDCCGVAGNDVLFEISAAVAENDAAAALKTVDGLIRNSKDMTVFINELTVHYRNLMLLKTMPGTPLVVMLPEEKQLYDRQLDKYSLQMIMRCLDILTDCLDGINRMKQTSQLRVMVEMVMLRLCTPKLDTDEKALSMRIDKLEQQLARGEFSAVQPKPQPEITPPPAQAAQPEIIDETGFAMPPIEAAQPEIIDETGFAMPPIEAAQPEIIDETGFAMPPVEMAQHEIIDETGFAMPPIEAAQHEIIDETGFAMPPIEAAQPEIIDETGFAMPPADEKKTAAKAPVHGTKQPVAVIGITEEELESEPQVTQWLEIADSLPPVMMGLMRNGKAYFHDGLMVLCVGAAARTVLNDGVRADILRDAAAKVLGKEYPIALAAEGGNSQKKKQDKLDLFLNDVKERGIQIITKNSSK